MRNGFEWLRLVTPLLSGLTLFLLAQIYTDVRELNAKLYQHQINAEIHLPRAALVELQRDLKEFIAEVHRRAWP